VQGESQYRVVRELAKSWALSFLVFGVVYGAALIKVPIVPQNLK